MRIRFRTVALPVASVMLAAAVVSCQDGESGAGKASASGPADFDRDGFADLVVTGDPGAGNELAVSYGAQDHGEGEKALIQEDVLGGKEDKGGGGGVDFGSDVATADLDGDGYTDLVIDVESDSPTTAKGRKVGPYVVWGGKDGLSTEAGAATRIAQAPARHSSGLSDEVAGPVAGDFNGDKHTDLVVDVGGEHGLLEGPFTREGKTAGAAKAPDDAPGPDGGPISEVMAADMNGDDADDLIVVHNFDDGMDSSTVTSYVPGGRDGFGKTRWDALPGIGRGATGDVNDDGYSDLIVCPGAPGESIFGPVEVVYGSKDGPAAGDGKEGGRREAVKQDAAQLGEGKDHRAGRCAALDAGDIDGDGIDDVVVGGAESNSHDGTDEDLATSMEKREPGGILVLQGGKKGLSGKDAQFIEPSKPLVGHFGEAVQLLDIGDDGKDDLAVGAPLAGEVRLLPGGADGVSEDKAWALEPRDFDFGPEGFGGRMFN